MLNLNQPGVQEAYSAWAATYDTDTNRTRDLDQTVTREALACAACQTIIELGCGTGKNTLFLSTIGGQVHAFDFSLGMINRAREKIFKTNVAFAMADFNRSWPCRADTADLIVCNLVLEHIQDISFIFAQAFRVLGNGGRFFVSELHPYRQYQGTKAHFQHHEETIQIPAHIHHISEFFDCAHKNGFTLAWFKESWHESDENKPPRLASFIFEKRKVMSDY